MWSIALGTHLLINAACAFLGICIMWYFFPVRLCSRYLPSPSRKMKSMQHVQVECWFCRAVTLVPPGNKNSFDCPECEQYNGFAEDGHYNKPIPAQYSEELNHVQSRPVGRHDNKPNPLCHVCQINQELKVQQLAAFIPTNENHFDREVEEYAQYLEGAYRLCPACNTEVSSELHRQDRDIQSKQLVKRLNHTMVNAVGTPQAHRGRKTIPMLRILAALSASLVLTTELCQSLGSSDADTTEQGILSNVSTLMTRAKEHRTGLCLLGLACNTSSSFLAGKYRLKYLDCLCPLLWMVYMAVVTSHSSLLHAVLETVLPSVMTSNLPLLVSASLLVACVGHAWQARVRPTKMIFTNRLSRNLGEAIPHQGSVPENPPESSVAPSTGTDSAAAPSQSSSSDSSEIKRILLDQSIMGGLSLGPRAASKPKNKDIWTAHTPPTSRPVTPMSEERPSSREFRPVISPATFNPSGLKRSASQTSFASSFIGAFSSAQPQDQRTELTREPLTDSGQGSCVPSLRDDSSEGSFPLGMTAKEHTDQTKTSPARVKHKPSLSGWLSFLLPCAFGFSLGINVAAAVYFMYGR